MKKYQAALFDLDGVVVDNHAHHFAAWIEFARRHQFALDAQTYRDKFNGKTNADLFTMIFGPLAEAKIIELTQEKESLYRETYRPVMKPLKGLREFLQRLSRQSIPVAIGSSAPLENVDFILDGLALRPFFKSVIHGGMVKKGKPHPEIYLQCAQDLGIAPEDCVVFEDAIAGIQAGLSAGCGVVGVSTSHSPEEIGKRVDFVIGDFCSPALAKIF
jgi:beta-phosphoglucomutase